MQFLVANDKDPFIFSSNTLFKVKILSNLNLFMEKTPENKIKDLKYLNMCTNISFFTHDEDFMIS